MCHDRTENGAHSRLHAHDRVVGLSCETYLDLRVKWQLRFRASWETLL